MKKLLSLVLAVAMMLTVGVCTPALQTNAQAAGKKLIALTFDDGPGPYTDRLLDGLKKQNVKATFFMLGSRAKAYPGTVARVYQEGHQVASHTYDHPDLTSLSDGSVQNQIWSTSDALHNTSGASNFYLRPPYGSVNKRVQSLVGTPVIYWSVDTRDWAVLNAAKVTANILADSYDGAIVLMHDIHSTTIDGVLNAISTLKDRGYEFVTVRELLRRRGVTPKNGEVYYDCKPNGTDSGATKAPSIQVDETDGSCRVSITAQSGAAIYYTTDGTDPLTKGKQYTGAFSVSTPCTVKALAAFHKNGDRSETVELKITKPTAKTPKLSIEDGVLTLSCDTKGATLYYTTDGTPATVGSVVYTAPVALEPGSCVSAVAGGAGLLTSKAVTGTYSDNGNFLRDVTPSQWFYQAVDRTISQGVMAGTGNHCFTPKGTVTRGQMMTILYNLSGETAGEEAVAALPFADVKPTDYFAAPIAWAYENKIVAGQSETTFAPKEDITREEMSQMIFSYLKHCGKLPEVTDTELPYQDSERISAWALEAVRNVTALGLFSGDTKGNFLPRNTAIRAEAAVVMCKILDN